MQRSNKMWDPKDKQIVFICSKCGGPGIATQRNVDYYKQSIEHADSNVCLAVKRNITKTNK